LPAAFNQREHSLLPIGAADLDRLALLLVHVLELATDVGFIGLDDLPGAAHGLGIDAQIGHGLTNTMAQEPSGFHAAPEHALKLAGGNAFLAGVHQVDGLKPQVQREVARLHDGADRNGELALAMAALTQAVANLPGLALHAFQRVDAVNRAALRAGRAFGPQPSLDVGKSGVFIAEMGLGKDGVSHGNIS